MLASPIMRHAEIIAIGSELLLGGRLDTNSLFLTEQLVGLSVEVRYKSVVGDEVDDIAMMIRAAARRSRIIILTGGLGPTRDDVTREAVAKVTRASLRRHPVALKTMSRRLAAWGRTPTPSQFRQARIPAGAAVLLNPVGSAPGFAMRWGNAFVVALPGVPAEAERMFAAAALPWLKAQLVPATSPKHIARRFLHTFGLPEATVEESFGPLRRSYRDVRLGFLASPRGVTVSFTQLDVKDKEKRLQKFVSAARRVLGGHVYAEGADTMEQVIGRMLEKRGWMLAVAESCTGGLIGHRLTEVPGSSAYLDRVAVCYSNRAKVELLGVPERLIRRHGAVSAQVALAMAQGIRRRSRVQIGLSVTGIAGPDGGTIQKPIGLVYVGLDAAIGNRTTHGARLTREFRFHGPRDAIKLRASQAALDTLRQWLDRKP